MVLRLIAAVVGSEDVGGIKGTKEVILCVISTKEGWGESGECAGSPSSRSWRCAGSPSSSCWGREDCPIAASAVESMSILVHFPPCALVAALRLEQMKEDLFNLRRPRDGCKEKA